MNSDDRIRRAFDDLEQRSEHVDPDLGLQRLPRGERTTISRHWVWALAGAAVVLAVLGSVALFDLLPGIDDDREFVDTTTTLTTLEEPTTTVTSGNPTTTTTTTSQPPVSGDLREPTHRVASVAADDTLAVRRAPGADQPLYARLAPTYSGVRFTGNTETVADGGEWWEVELLDPVRLIDLGEPLHGAPIVGWVNSFYLESYDPSFADVPACFGDGLVDALTPDADAEVADHIFQIRQYELGDDCLRVVITFGTDFDDSGIAPRYDMIGTDMRPVGNVPPIQVEQLQYTTVIRLEGIDHAWATESTNVSYDWPDDSVLSAFAVRETDRSIAIYLPTIGWPAGVTANPATGQLVVDVRRIAENDPWTGGGIHLVGEPVLTDGGTLEFIGLARPFEATVGVEIRDESGAVVVEDFAMTTDWTEAWGLFRYRRTGLDPSQRYTVTIDQDAEPEPVGVTFEIGGKEFDAGVDPAALAITDADLALVDTLIGFAQGTVDFSELSFADRVTLSLSDAHHVVIVNADERLFYRSNWVIDLEDFDGLVGPFDVMGPLRREIGIAAVNVGPRTHCAGPPLDFAPEWDEGRHLVIEPTGIDSCLQWYAVHVLVDDTDQIQAVTLDLYGP